MIDWDDNAKAAVKDYDEWLNEPDNSLSDRPLDEFMTARLPTQTKTVADAVEWANGEWIGDSRFIVYQEELGKFAFVVSEKPYMNGWFLVCTREEFEAYVKEQEGEKWTHDFYGEKCRVLIPEPDTTDEIVILLESGIYTTVAKDDVKSIKPTMTKEQHEFLCKFSADSNKLEVISEVESYLSKHDII